MQISNNEYENHKNKIRLIQQNMKLRNQIEKFNTQLRLHIDKQDFSETKQQKQQMNQTLRFEISKQEKYIKELRKRIQYFKERNVKDNAQYILKEQNELITIKKNHQKVQGQRNVFLNLRNDKLKQLETNKPLQKHKLSLLGQLKEVIKNNKEKSILIVDLERQIRKHHLAKESAKIQSMKPIVENQILKKAEEIENNKKKLKELEEIWKPQYKSLDQQYHQQHKIYLKKLKEVEETVNGQKLWQTRMAPIREDTKILDDKKRKSAVVTNPKLKKQIEQYIQKEQTKKKKKVDTKQLMFQFKTTAEEQQNEKKASEKQDMKKKEQRVYETMEDDKNIVKFIQKNPVKKTKNDMSLNTDEKKPTKSEVSSIKSRKSKASKKKEDSTSPKQIGNQNEERSERKWEEDEKLSENPELPSLLKNKIIALETKKRRDQKDVPNNLFLKNIGMGTSFNAQDEE